MAVTDVSRFTAGAGSSLSRQAAWVFPHRLQRFVRTAWTDHVGGKRRLARRRVGASGARPGPNAIRPYTEMSGRGTSPAAPASFARFCRRITEATPLGAFGGNVNTSAKSTSGMNMHRLVKALLVLSLLPLSAAAQTGSETVALEGARVIDGTGRAAIESGTVLLRNGRFQAVGGSGSVTIPQSARRIQLAGKTLMPALVDLHTHLGQTVNGLDPAPDAYNEQNLHAQLQRLLAYGVGTVVVMGTDRDLIYTLRAEQRAGKVEGARFFTAGRGFGMKGGFPGGAAMDWDVYRPVTPEEARAAVRELAAHHPDFVKIWLDDGYGRMPKMPPSIYGAVIDEAHRHHLRVVAHVYYLADAKGLIAAGVDELAHSIRDQSVDQELVAAMKARNVMYLATLVRDESTFAYAEGPAWLSDTFFQAGLLASTLEKFQSAAFRQHAAQDPDLARNRASLEMGERNLKILADAGVRIGFGTDAGVPGRFLGYFEHRELQLMVMSGLTPLQAIVCATHNAAAFLGNDFGTIEPGKRADFLVLDANPLEDIYNTEKLSAVWQSGIPLKPIAK